MCIPHLKSRFTEIDSEIFLINLCYALCLIINFWFSEWGGRGQRGEGSGLFPPLGVSLVTCICQSSFCSRKSIARAQQSYVHAFKVCTC